MTDREYEIMKMQRDAAIQESNELYEELQSVRYKFHQYQKEMDKKLRTQKRRRAKRKTHQPED